MVAVTVLFNGGKLCPDRIHRCMQFLIMYPNVVLLTNVQGLSVINKMCYYECAAKGFIDYVLINKFLEEEKPKQLTYIDNDLILPEGYFNEILLENDIPRIVQGFKVCFEVSDKKRIAPSIVCNYNTKMFNKSKRFFGHSGYCWTFNEKMLQLIEYKFPEFFLAGGFDFFLATCMMPKFRPIIDNELLEWYYMKFHKAEYGYINVEIEHMFHGSHEARLTDFKNYNKQCLERFINEIN